MDDDPKSGYRQLVKAAIPEPTYSQYFRRYPFARALRDFKTDQKVCLFPTSLSAVTFFYPDTQFELEFGEAIDRVSAHVISASGTIPISSMEELNGKTFAVQFGVIIPQAMKQKANATVLRTPDDLTALKMVLAGRATAMYGWFPDTYIIAEKNKLALPRFDPNLIIYQTTTHFVCKKFDGSQAILDTIDKNIIRLKENGHLQNMLGKYARVVK